MSRRRALPPAEMRCSSVNAGYQGVWGRCSRKVWRDGRCKQHHPETVKARAAARTVATSKKLACEGLARERWDLRIVVAWLEKRAPGSGLFRRAQAEVEKLTKEIEAIRAK